MFRRPDEHNGCCDADMQCADSTAAALVIAAAVVGNTQSYCKSFNEQLTTKPTPSTCNVTKAGVFSAAANFPTVGRNNSGSSSRSNDSSKRALAKSKQLH